MALEPNEITTYLANQARVQELERAVAGLTGEVNTAANLASMLSQASADTQRRLQAKLAELAALKTGSGPGVTDDFGPKDTILTAFLVEIRNEKTVDDQVLQLLVQAAGVTLPEAVA